MNKNYLKLKRKIIEATFTCPVLRNTNKDIVSIADILLVLRRKLLLYFIVLPSGNLYLFEGDETKTPIASWNLRHNFKWHYNNRPETIKFLEDLIL